MKKNQNEDTPNKGREIDKNLRYKFNENRPHWSCSGFFLIDKKLDIKKRNRNKRREIRKVSRLICCFWRLFSIWTFAMEWWWWYICTRIYKYSKMDGRDRFNRSGIHSIFHEDHGHGEHLQEPMVPTIQCVALSSSKQLQLPFHRRQRQRRQRRPSSNPRRVPPLRSATPIRRTRKSHIRGTTRWNTERDWAPWCRRFRHVLIHPHLVPTFECANLLWMRRWIQFVLAIHRLMHCLIPWLPW